MLILKGNKLRQEDLELLKQEFKNSDMRFKLIVEKSRSECTHYVNMIAKVLDNVGGNYQIYEVDKNTKFDLTTLTNNDKLIIARPIVNENYYLDLLNEYNDPDMLGKYSNTRLYVGDNYYLPATPKSCLRLLEYYGLLPKRRNCLVVGRSISVGRPLFTALNNLGNSVHVAHSQTTDDEMQAMMDKADYVFLCTGVKGVVKREYFKPNHIVIDCGYNENGEGDLGFIPEDGELFAYSPVPGGVGPITITTLLRNSVKK